MCPSNKNTSTTSNTSSAPPPEVMQQYMAVLQRANAAANTPYQQYTGPRVAGFTGDQNTAFQTIRDTQGKYLDQATGLAQRGSAQIGEGDISRYTNPYQRDVIGATMANINDTNAQQRQGLVGNAISSGAWGGDRAGVAQAELARQQSLASNQTLAGLNSQNYSQALGAAQADRAAAGQGAYTMAGLQNTALQGAGAQLQAGGLQQQLGQAGLNVDYSNFKEQRAYPFQIAQWLAGISSGIGSNTGGTSSTTTTPPPPNWLNSLIGGGLTAYGMYNEGKADGGRVMGTFAGGGLVPYSSDDYIPTIALTRGLGPPKPPTSAASTTAADDPLKTGMSNLMKGLSSRRGSMGDGSVEPISSATSFSMEETAPLLGMRRGGLVNPKLDHMVDSAVHLARKMRGGIVQPDPNGIYLPRGYAEGGMPLFDDRYAPVREAIADGTFDPQGANSIVADDRRLAGLVAGLAARQPDAGMTDFGGQRRGLAPDAVPLPRPRPAGAMVAEEPAETPRGLAPRPQPSYAESGPLYAEPQAGLAPRTPAQSGDAEPRRNFLGLPALSDEAKLGLMKAGLGMMASKSPFLGQAIGEGGLAGVEGYQAAKKTKFDEAYRQETLGIQKQTAAQGAQRLAQQAEQFAKSLQLQTDQLGLQRDKATMAPEGFRKTDDGLEFIPRGPQDPALIGAQTKAKNEGKEKPIPTAIQKDLGDKAAAFHTLDSLSSSFKPEYSGWVSGTVGDIANTVARNVPGVGNKDAANWWQQYAAYRNVVRNKLFGSALTGHEIKEWEKADIGPGMDPKVATTNITRQHQIVHDAMQRRASSLGKQGYSKDAIESELGITFGELGAAGKGAAKPAGQSPVLQEARDAISRGASRDAVIERLRSRGIDPSGL